MSHKPTDSATLGMQALTAMDSNAARVRAVTERIVAEYADLPPLLAIRPEAGAECAELSIQPRTTTDALTWGAALGASIKVDYDEDTYGWHMIRTAAVLVVDGIRVRLGACEQYSATEWAALSRTAVAA